MNWLRYCVDASGSGFGTTMTSMIFLGCIVAPVIYMTMKKDNGQAGQILLESE